MDDETLDRLQTTRGLISEREGAELARRAAWVHPNRAIVEIGTHSGLSTMWLASGARAHVFAVDPWEDPRPLAPEYNDDPFALETGDAVLDEFSHNLDRFAYRERITPLRARSVDVARMWVQPVGLLFIDAIHTFEGVEADYEAWWSHIAKGGWLAIHDYGDSYPGVKEAVDEVAVASGLWTDVHLTGSLWTARRR